MKYRLTYNKKEINGVTLYQIECVEPFGNVKQGDCYKATVEYVEKLNEIMKELK